MKQKEQLGSSSNNKGKVEGARVKVLCKINIWSYSSSTEPSSTTRGVFPVIRNWNFAVVKYFYYAMVYHMYYKWRKYGAGQLEVGGLTLVAICWRLSDICRYWYWGRSQISPVPLFVSSRVAMIEPFLCGKFIQVYFTIWQMPWCNNC